MKKIISMLLIVTLVLSLGLIPTFADEAVASNYTGDYTPGTWLNQFDGDGNCFGYSYTIFNAAAPFTAIVLPELYAGKSAEDRDADVLFELFSFTGEKAATLAADPIFKLEQHFDGDTKDTVIDFGKTMAKGQYLFKVSQTSANDDNNRTTGPYAVLPKPTEDYLYASDKVEFYSPIDTAGFCYKVVYDGSVADDAFFAEIVWSTPVSFKDDKTVSLVIRPMDSPAQRIQNMDYAILTPEIPEGKVLRYFTFKNAPTWQNTNGDSDLDYEVYVWNNDYETSYSTKPIKSGNVLNHADNQDLTLDFGARLTGGRRYLIVVYASNDGPVGFWTGNTIRKEGWEFFMDGEETTVYAASEYRYSTYTGPAETDEPTEPPTDTPAPTEPPTEVVTPEVTEAPQVTEAPKVTNAPEATPEAKSNGCGGFAAGGAVVLCALAAAAFISLKKKEN